MVNAQLIARLILIALCFTSFSLQAQTGTLVAGPADSLGGIKPYASHITVETGPILCNQAEKFKGIDLDGPADIYGETEIIHDVYFFNAALTWGLKEGHDITGKYSLVKLNESREAKIGDTLSVDDQYPLFRHQFYVNSTIRFGKGFHLIPAVHFLLDCYESVLPVPLDDSTDWYFPVEKYRTGSFIGYLAAAKDFKYLQALVFTAISNLDEKTQFQAGAQLVAYPLGNKNLILSSKILDHNDDGKNNLVFEQIVGGRLSKEVYAEAGASFGEMSNYYNNHGAEVYSLYQKLTFTGSAKIICEPGPRLKISAEYRYLAGESCYTYYEAPVSEKSGFVPVSEYREYLSQVYLLGVRWEF